MARTLMEYGAATAQGVWPVQEDGYYLDPAFGLFFLCDGMGGEGRGNLLAGDLLVQAGGFLRAKLQRQEEHLRQAFQLASERAQAWNEGKSWSERASASLLGLMVAPERNWVTLAGVGANGAFLVRAGKLNLLMRPETNGIGYGLPARMLGGSTDETPELRRFPVQPGDVIGLYTQGLLQGREGALEYACEMIANLGAEEQPLENGLEAVARQVVGENEAGINTSIVFVKF